MQLREYQIKFARHPDHDRVVKATSHGKAKMHLAYELAGTSDFQTFADVLLAIASCRVLQRMKPGRKVPKPQRTI